MAFWVAVVVCVVFSSLSVVPASAVSLASPTPVETQASMLGPSNVLPSAGFAVPNVDLDWDPANPPLICSGEGSKQTESPARLRSIFWVPAGGKATLRMDGVATEKSYFSYWRLQGNPTVEMSSLDPGLNFNKSSLGLFDYYYPKNGNPAQTRAFTFQRTWTATGDALYQMDSLIQNYFGNNLSYTFSVRVVDASGNPVANPFTGCEGSLQMDELFGPNDTLKNECPCRGDAGDPVNTWSGNEHMPLPGIGVPGRGPGLGFSLAHNSRAAGTDSDVGYGWSHSYGMSVAAVGDSMLVRQEAGAAVRFYPDGSGGWEAPGRFNAALVDNGDGTWTFERNHFEFFTFDSTGKLTSIGDRDGYETTLAYSGGLLDTVTDEAGRTLTFGWSSGRIASVTDSRSVADGGPRNVTLTHTGGDLTGYTDVAGNEWRLVYDTAHRWTKLYRPNGAAELLIDPLTTAFVENTYDGFGRVLTQTDEENRTITFEYDTPTAGSTSITAPDGDIRIDAYVNGLRETVVTGAGSPAETTTQFTYDADTLGVTEMIDGDNKTWEYGYDSAGNRNYTKDPLGRETHATYNTFDQPLSVTDGEGVVTEMSYDTAGNLEDVTAAVGVAGVETTTDYLYGDITHPGDVTGIVDGRNKQWSTAFDPATGYPVSTTDPEGNVTTVDYNSIGFVDSTVAAKGNEIGATAEDHRTHFVYNDYGDVTSVTNPEDEQTVTVYDLNRNVTSVTDPDNEITAYTYNDANEPVTVTTGHGTAAASTITYTYFDDGAQQSWSNGLDDTWNYTYDQTGRLETQTDPNNNVTAYEYNNRGAITAVTQPGGDCDAGTPTGCISYGYDDAGQPTSVNYRDPSTPDIDSYTYDDAGRRLTATITAGPTTTWDWNELGQLISHTNDANRTVTYTYDHTGNLDTILYPGQTTPVDYAYDDAGRMESVTDWLNNTTTFDYDANSNLETTTFPTGTSNVDTYTYDRANRVDTITWTKDTTTLGSLDYDRDPDGLINTATPTGLPAGSDEYGYDSRDQLTTVDTITDHTYDLAGNPTQLPDGRLQVFDPAQQLCWNSPTTGSGACSTPPADATTFDYDDRGNRTSETGPDDTEQSYVYDQADRLIQADVIDRTGSGYQPVTPATVLDTRTASQTGKCPTVTTECVTLNATNGRALTVQVGGQAGLPEASEIEAVMLNVTILNTDLCVGCDGVLSIYPADIAWPWTSVVNYDQDGAVETNSLISRIDDNGQIVVLTNYDTDVLITVAGYFTASDTAGGFDAVDPARLMDNTGTGDCLPVACGRLGGSGTPNYRDIKAIGVGGVPDTPDVTAVAVNITTVNASAAGFLMVNGKGQDPAFNLIYQPDTAASNMVIVPIGDDGRITVAAWGGQLDALVDIYGYFTGDTNSHGGYHPIDTPELLVLAHDGQTPIGACPDTAAQCTPLQSTVTKTVQVAGQGTIPDDVTAVAVNITVTPDATGWLSAWPDDGTAYPWNATLAYNTDTTKVAHAIIPVGDNGRIQLFATANADLRIDVYGYFADTNTVTYEYDPDGLRTTKTSSHTGTSEYTWNHAAGIPLLLTEHHNSESTHIIYGRGGLPVSEITGTGVVYYHHDHLGSTRLTTNDTGDPVGSYTYAPNGKLETSTGTHAPRLGWASQYTDQETGHTYLRARYHDPNTNQYLTRDPLLAATHEPYSYANNNPTNNTDPLGLFSLGDAWDATGGKAVSTVSGVGKQDVANFAGGVLNTITFGNEERINTWLGQEDKVDRCSGWYKAGEYTGYAVDAAFVAHGGVSAWRALNSGRGIGLGEFARIARHPAHRAVPSTLKGGPERLSRWLAAHPDFRTHMHYTWRGVRSVGR